MSYLLSTSFLTTLVKEYGAIFVGNVGSPEDGVKGDAD